MTKVREGQLLLLYILQMRYGYIDVMCLYTYIISNTNMIYYH